MNVGDVIKLYDQPWRYHHTRKHIESIQKASLTLDFFDKDDKYAFYYASIFHDAVYEPKASDNEEKSNALWLQYCKEEKVSQALRETVSGLIMLTKHPCQASGILEKEFIHSDWNDMGRTEVITDKYAEWLEEYEDNIFREYQMFSVEDYVAGRTNVIKNAYLNGLITKPVHDYLMPLATRKRRVGIYAGSFLPFHVGHLNVLRKAERMFDKVIVAQGVNPEKKGVDRNGFDNVGNILPHHQVESYSGQLVDYVNSKRSEFCEPVLVRGLRNGYDLNQETNLIRFVDEQADARGIKRIPIAYISCDKEFEHVSSSAIRTLEPADIKRYLPDAQ